MTAESIHLTDLEFVCVKVPVFSFSRLRGCDPLLGVEMRSTGEVAKLSNNNGTVNLHCRLFLLILVWVDGIPPVWSAYSNVLTYSQVACFGADKHEAFLKAMVSAGLRLPLMRRSLMLVTGS